MNGGVVSRTAVPTAVQQAILATLGGGDRQLEWFPGGIRLQGASLSPSGENERISSD